MLVKLTSSFDITYVVLASSTVLGIQTVTLISVVFPQTMVVSREIRIPIIVVIGRECRLEVIVPFVPILIGLLHFVYWGAQIGRNAIASNPGEVGEVFDAAIHRILGASGQQLSARSIIRCFIEAPPFWRLVVLVVIITAGVVITPFREVEGW